MAKILIIDDKKDNLITISAMIKNLLPGYDIVTALSGEEGIRKAMEENPDTILLDIIMPGMDGFETCSILKSSHETKYIPIIVLTAIRSDSKMRIRALEVGADAFLCKPVDDMELVAQVKAMSRIKYSEDLLRKENELLEEKVRERTKDLIAYEKLLNEQLSFLQILIDTIPAPVFYKDINGVYLGSNLAFEKFTGLKIENIKGKQVYDIFAPDLADKYNEMDRILLRNGGVQVYEGEVVYGDSSIHDVVFTKTVFKKSDGSTGGILGFILDITDRKKGEEEREKLKKQLYHAEKMNAIGTLAGGIAHDFNNILGGILGYTELVMDGMEENSQLRSHLKQILKAVNRAKELIKQILIFSRENRQIEKKPVNIVIVIKEALKLMRATIPSTVEIKQNIHTNSSIVIADITQIHQVIVNLCTNASHAMKDRGGLLEISLENIDIREGELLVQECKAGSYVKLSVKDTGYGMDRITMEHMFEPYFTTKSQNEGTGLGLSVVHGIVKSHGGFIKVYSEQDRGTVFHVYFPRIKTEIQEQKADERPSSGGEGNILFIDDEEGLASLAEQLLGKLGYKVISHTDSMKALAIFREDRHKFDLVITDQTMPKMTGIELARTITSIRPDIPVILCTGFSEYLNEPKVMLSGIKKIILKPFVRKEMAEAIRYVLQKNPDSR